VDSGKSRAGVRSPEKRAVYDGRMMSSRLATLYTARTLAAACLYDTLRELNFKISDFKDWCKDVGKVDDRDVDGASSLVLACTDLSLEAVEDLRMFGRNGIGRE
jgi:hypothetical protein